MASFIDLHLHYIPGVDDGVTTLEDSIKVCRELKAIGYGRLVTTPHIRSGMFENRRQNLEVAFAELRRQQGEDPSLPELDLSAEHHCDGLFLDLLEAGELLPYPGS